MPTFLEYLTERDEKLYKSILKHYANWFKNTPSSDERRVEKKWLQSRLKDLSSGDMRFIVKMAKKENSHSGYTMNLLKLKAEV